MGNEGEIDGDIAKVTIEFDYSVLNQKPNNWALTHVEYEGEGIAEFQEPKGRVWGKTKVVFDEFSEYSISMQVEGMETEKPLPLGLDQLISADQPKEENGKITLPMPPSKYNLCKKLSVKTPDGEFVAENIEWVLSSFEWNVEMGKRETLYFHPRQSYFDAINSNPTQFWVMPLINFISKFMQYDASLGNHPLRIYPDAPIPPNIPAEKREMAEYVVRQRSRLILFEFNETLGFIEALPDYEEKETRLTNRQIPSAITSVMVGEIGNNSIELDQIENWFPFYFLELLGVAIGNEVAVPWLEFRDVNGNLVRRVHGSMGFGHSLFIKGEGAIDEVIHRGTGRLLTVAQSFAELDESYFRVAIRHTILGMRNSQTIEDRLDHFCRALDSLCEHYGLSQQNLLSLTNNADKNKIQSVVSQAASVVQSIIEVAQGIGDMAQSRYLQSVIGRLSNVTNQDRKFGLAVCDLLKIFNFPDADILDAHFVNNPRKDNLKKWADVLSSFRGRVIHTGYFNFRTNEHEFEDIWTVIQHLNDILFRILFSMLGYDGKYSPPELNYRGEMLLDWVKPDTPARNLGYK
jgi:hypothetical protein